MKRFKYFSLIIMSYVTPVVFGMHEDDQISYNDLIVRRAKNILTNVQTVGERIKKVETNPVVLLGATGSGKTSLLHILAGTKMMASMSDDAAILSGRYSLIPDKDAMDKIGKVAGGGESVTSDIHTFPIGDVVYCDGPGFFDTDGGFTEIGNHLSMNEILKTGTKVLWVVSVSELTAMRGGSADRSLDYLLGLLPADRSTEAERKARSIGIVISQGSINGSAQNGLKLLQRGGNHHWIIDYLSDHAETNAFWFPAPKEDGIYAPPLNLVAGITDFARKQSDLITASMGLQPCIISDLKAMHTYFDVSSEIDEIVKCISHQLESCKDTLKELKQLKVEAFDKLWYSLAAISLNQTRSEESKDQNKLVKQWRRNSFFFSRPQQKFNFTLQNFVDALNGVEYFCDICNVQALGFASRFERGAVWEELVKCLSEHSNTPREEIDRLRATGNKWKERLPSLTEKDTEVNKAIDRKKREQFLRTVVASVCAGFGGVLGGFGGIAAGVSLSAVAGSVAAGGVVGGVGGAIAGPEVVNVAQSARDFLTRSDNSSDQPEQ